MGFRLIELNKEFEYTALSGVKLQKASTDAKKTKHIRSSLADQAGKLHGSMISTSLYSYLWTTAKKKANSDVVSRTHTIIEKTLQGKALKRRQQIGTDVTKTTVHLFLVSGVHSSS